VRGHDYVHEFGGVVDGEGIAGRLPAEDGGVGWYGDEGVEFLGKVLLTEALEEVGDVGVGGTSGAARGSC